MAIPLTLTSPTYNGTGKFGSSLSGGYGQTAAPAVPGGLTFTVEAWVKTTSSGAIRVAMGQANAFWLGMDASGKALANYGWSGTAVSLTSTTTVNDGSWHHLELDVDATTGARLFVDGTQVDSDATTPATANIQTAGGNARVFDVGAFRSSGFSTFDWVGEVDEAALWSIARHSSGFTPEASAYTGGETGLLALWHLDGNGNDSVLVDPTSATLTGPATGSTGVASSNFTVTLDRAATSTVTVTPAGTNGTVTFSPGSPTITAGNSSTTFTANPALDGAHDISITTSPTLTYPGSPITYTSSSAAATAVTMTGPTAGTVGVASSNFTVGANGAITGTVTVTPAATGGGTFSPTSVNISSGTPTATFTYTAASTGTKTISCTNSGGLSNPSTISYVASAAALYTRVDTTDPIGGQNIMVLVPSSGSSNPYSSGTPTGVIIYSHGAGEVQDALLTDSLKSTCVTALLDAGYILAGTAAHGSSNWGNQASCDDYVALEKYLRDNYNVKGVCLWGQSMGGLNGLQVIAQGKFPVLGFMGTYPVCNLANLHSLGVYTGAINTAHSITGSGSGTYANRTRGLDPALLTGFSWRHVPMRFYASSGDTVVPKADNTDVLAALVAGCCRESTVVACSGNHGDTTHFVPAEYVAFFDRCFATPCAQGRPATTKTVTITLTSDGTTPRANLTGLKWSWWDQITPDLGEYPTDKGTGETTDASGVLTIAVRSQLAAAGVGWLIVTDSDGTTTQSPAAKAFSGPVAVA